MSQIIQQLKSLNVLVIGDFCIDIFKYGSINRISPEAPVPVFDFLYETRMNGMSGNVHNNLCNLGINSTLIKNSELLYKIRYIDEKSKQHLLREDITEQISHLNIQNIQSYDYDAVIITDYDKGFLQTETIKSLLTLFKCPIFVDSKKRDLSVYENCIIKINKNEYEKVIKFPNNCELIVTLGEQGARYKDKIIPTNTVQVFDVSGAGDTFIASLVTQYLLSKNLEKSIKFANLCSSIVVSKSGTVSVHINEVIDDICI